MRKLGGILLIVVAAVALTGCGEPEPASQQRGSVEQSVEPTEAPVESADITAAGEVCDPHNLNDAICAAFYPEQVVLNVTAAPRAREPLASFTDEQKIELARAACAHMEEGGTAETLNLVDTIPLPGDPEGSENRNNFSVFTAGTLAYCHEYLEERPRAFIDYYADLGEEASKADFADKTMPEL